MKWFSIVCVVLFLGVYLPLLAIAEDISNYSDCDVCHGAIHFGQKDTAGFLDKNLYMEALKGIAKGKVLKIDLDGVLINGTADTPDEGYELKIWGKNVFFIQELRDKSLVQVVWLPGDTENGEQDEGYHLDIYMEPGHDLEIDLKDSVDEAWKKMRFTQIYRWVGKTSDKEKWKILLGEKILDAAKQLQSAQ